MKLTKQKFKVVADALRSRDIKPWNEATLVIAEDLFVHERKPADIALERDVTNQWVCRVRDRFKLEAMLEPQTYIEEGIAKVLQDKRIPGELRTKVINALSLAGLKIQ